MYDICCIGHITLDRVTTPAGTVEMPGGTSYYFSHALRQLDLRYLLVTTLAPSEQSFASSLEAVGVEVKVFPGEHTVCFENIYRGDMDHREQKVSQKSTPFSLAQVEGIGAELFHLGPLLADDIPADLIRYLSTRGTVSMDVQGLLRELRGEDVYPVDWPEKRQLLPCIDILKANEEELFVLTGETDLRKGAMLLNGWGVKEVVITSGSKGSFIYLNGEFTDIPAYIPGSAVDATGCGDTYMAGYLYQRVKGATPAQAGHFAAAIAGLKVSRSGPFSGSEQDVLKFMNS